MNPEFDYRSWLERLYSERVQRNPRYSQAAFARSMGLTPTRLNKILKNKLGLSAKSASEIADRLRLDADGKQMLLLRVQASDSRSKEKRRHAMEQLAHMGVDSRLDFDIQPTNKQKSGDRDFSAMIAPLRREDVLQMLDWIRLLRKNVADRVEEKSEQPREVYCLTILVRRLGRAHP